MRVSILTVSAAFLSLGSAQMNTLPTCAQSCVAGFTSSGLIAGCAGIDIHCICSSGGFLQGIACCLAANCGQADISTAIQFAKNICAIADPPVSVPNEVVCTSTATTGAPTGTASTTATASTTMATASSTAATASSTAATASPTMATASPSSTPSTTAGGVTAATIATTATTTAAPASSIKSSSTVAAVSTTTSSAAAGFNKVGGAGVGFAGGLAAALVLL